MSQCASSELRAGPHSTRQESPLSLLFEFGSSETLARCSRGPTASTLLFCSDGCELSLGGDLSSRIGASSVAY